MLPMPRQQQQQQQQLQLQQQQQQQQQPDPQPVSNQFYLATMTGQICMKSCPIATGRAMLLFLRFCIYFIFQGLGLILKMLEDDYLRKLLYKCNGIDGKCEQDH